MELRVNVIRTKVGNEILETFSVDKKNSYIVDDRRFIYHLYSFVVCIVSLHKKGFRLLEIVENLPTKTFIYEFDENIKNIKLNETLILRYDIAPSKKCKYCIHSAKGVCLMRGKYITKNSHYKCIYWQEINCYEREEIYGVYEQSRPDKNKRTYKAVPTGNKLWGKYHFKV